MLCDALGHVVAIILNPAAPLVSGLVAALQALLAPLHIAVCLGERRRLRRPGRKSDERLGKLRPQWIV